MRVREIRDVMGAPAASRNKGHTGSPSHLFPGNTGALGSGFGPPEAFKAQILVWLWEQLVKEGLCRTGTISCVQ